MTQKPSALTAEQIADAARLKALYDAQPDRPSQQAFGLSHGIGSQGMVWQYLNGRRPLNVEAAVKFARALKVPVRDFSPSLAAELAQLHEEPLTEEAHAGDELAAEVTPATLRDAAGYVLLPLLDVTASAGKTALPVDHVEVLRHVEVLAEWVRMELRASPTHIRIITARGDSMSPTIRSGDVVFVDVSVTQMDSNGLYALFWDDHVVLKRLQKLRDGRLAIRSDNPAYETEFAGRGDPLRICGRVLGRWGLERF